jgi:2-C-methyl-D-erythritol 4-phosphate cytidylyltransferase
LRRAHTEAYAEKFYGTDEASLVERINEPIKLLKGSYNNIKITTPEDLEFAEAFIKKENL